MRNRLLWKLLFTNILPVIGVIFLVVWLAVDKLAAQYFMELMKIYDVSPSDIHQMFLASIHQYLIWASLAALALAFVLSFLLTRRVLRPLSQMTAITREVAAGNFSLRAEITTGDEVGELGIAFNQRTKKQDNLTREVDNENPIYDFRLAGPDRCRRNGCRTADQAGGSHRVAAANQRGGGQGDVCRRMFLVYGKTL